MAGKKKQQTTNKTVTALTMFAVRNAAELEGLTLAQIRGRFRQEYGPDYMSRDALTNVLNDCGVKFSSGPKKRTYSPDRVRVLSRIVAELAASLDEVCRTFEVKVKPLSAATEQALWLLTTGNSSLPLFDAPRDVDVKEPAADVANSN